MGWPGEFLFLLQQLHLSPGFPWHWSPTQASSTLPLGWVSSSWEMGWTPPTWSPCTRWMGRSRGTFSRMTSPTTFPGLIIIIMLMVTVILMTKQCNIDAGNYLHWNVQKVGKWNFSKCRSVSVMTVGNTIKQSLTHDANDDTAMWKQQRHCVWLHYNVQPLLCVESNLGSQVLISHPEYSPGSYFANILFSPFQSTSTYILYAQLGFHPAKCCSGYSWLAFIIVKIPFWELPPIVRLEYLIGESLDRTGLRKKFWASHTGRTVEFSIGCKVVGLKSFTGWGSIPLGISHFPTTMFGQPTRTLSPYRQARSFTRLLLDSIAVSIFVDVLVELINTVFVN